MGGDTWTHYKQERAVPEKHRAMVLEYLRQCPPMGHGFRRGFDWVSGFVCFAKMCPARLLKAC